MASLLKIGSLDVTPLAFLAAGVAMGLLLRKRPRVLKGASKATTVAVWLLLLVMGIAVGSDPQVIRSFHELALQAGVISLASIAGSIIATMLICGWIFRNHGRER